MSSQRSDWHTLSLTSEAWNHPAARLCIDGMDVSRSVTSVEIQASSREGISATVHFCQPLIDVNLAEARILVDAAMTESAGLRRLRSP